MTFESVACDLCGSSGFQPLYLMPDRVSRSGEFQIVTCTTCGLVFVNPRPGEEEMRRYYPNVYGSYQLLRGFRRLVKYIFLRLDFWRVRRLIGRCGRILDVGAGAGEDAAYLRDHGGWQVDATDVGEFAAEQAKQCFNLNMRVGPLESLRLPAEAYDLIRMRYVLSHVHSPRRTLAEVHRVLKPGGWLILWVPNIDSVSWRIFRGHWEGGEPPRHLFDFSPRTLTRYLESAGFAPIRISQSIVPNTAIHSARNAIESAGAPRLLQKLFTLNPLTLLVFTPLSLLAAILGQSDRIMVIARKRTPT